MTTRRKTPTPTATDPARLPAAIYCRISRDRAGAGLGVERQREDCEALAARLGWDVRAVFVDNDISAYSGARRPEYEQMIQAIEDGRIRGVIAWHTDRLHRRAIELERFVTLAEAHDLAVQTVTAGSTDLSTASGRMVARMLGAAAQHEIDHARERMRSAKRQMAADGKYRGGPRPFGYEKDGITVRESEAAVIRKASKAILAGRSLTAVARDLNDAGEVTSTGKPWTYARLRDVLVRPRNAGLLHQGRADRGEAEIVGPAQWPAIIDEETWRALYARLLDPSRRKQDGNDTRWLGSGIYICGRCGATMRPAPYGGTAASKNRTRKHLYRCSEKAHLTISTDKTDEYVMGVLVDLVRDPRVVAAMQPDQGGAETADRERRAVLAARLDSFETDYAEGRITGTQLQKATARITAEIGDIDERLSRNLRRSLTSPVANAPDPGQALLDAPVDVQRGVLRAVLRVTVQLHPYRGAAWTADRLTVEPVAAS